MRKFKYLVFATLVTLYAFFLIATKKQPPCDGDCEKMNFFNSNIKNGRDYVVWSFRCGPNPASDTICIYVKDTTGVNWNLFADTACSVSAQAGLVQQKIFVIKNFSSPADTVARKNCP